MKEEALVSIRWQVAGVIRVTLGLVYFPHGMQKLFGWFGGRGFSGTITSYGQLYHLPAAVVVLAIAAEPLGSLGLIFGFLTRFDAFAIALDMLGAIKLVTLQNGFFMNWAGKQHGEGNRVPDTGYRHGHRAHVERRRRAVARWHPVSVERIGSCGCWRRVGRRSRAFHSPTRSSPKQRPRETRPSESR